MKQWLLAMLSGAALLTGCASRYVVTLNNGQRIVAVKKPRLEGFSFVFTDLNDRTNSIPSTRVRAIAPTSSQTTVK
jgi:hypothetical protein